VLWVWRVKKFVTIFAENSKKISFDVEDDQISLESLICENYSLVSKNWKIMIW
jgi:hypothetical protein